MGSEFAGTQPAEAVLQAHANKTALRPGATALYAALRAAIPLSDRLRIRVAACEGRQRAESEVAGLRREETASCAALRTAISLSDRLRTTNRAKKPPRTTPNLRSGLGMTERSQPRTDLQTEQSRRPKPLPTFAAALG